MILRMKTDDVICHSYRVQIGADFYNVIAVGNRYKVEQYLRHECGASVIQWLKSFICNDQKVLSRGKFCKVIGREGFVLKMEYAYPLSTIRSKVLNDKQDKRIKKAMEEGCAY